MAANIIYNCLSFYRFLLKVLKNVCNSSISLSNYKSLIYTGNLKSLNLKFLKIFYFRLSESNKTLAPYVFNYADSNSESWHCVKNNSRNY